MSFKAVSSVLLLAALVSTSSATRNSTSDIKSGFANSYQRYFVYNDEPLTFFEAWHKCRAHGLRLASVHSMMDNIKLMAALAQKDINQQGPWWIAGTDLGKNGSFVWITSNKPVGAKGGYTNFAAGEPNNVDGDEHCLMVGHPAGTLWNDGNCESKFRYICEMDTCDC